MQRNRFATSLLRRDGPATGRLRSPGAAVRLAIAMFGVALLAALALPADVVFALAEEHGVIETLQAFLLLALAAAALLFRRPGADALTTGSIAFLLFAMGARELEWHKAWIGGSVLKPRFYLGPATPGTKLFAGVLVLLLAASALYLVQRHAREAWNRLRRGDPLAVTTATFLAALVVSRFADKTHLGHPLSRVVAGTLIVEEMLELALPLLVLLGGFQYSAARAKVPALEPDSVLLPTTVPVREGS